MCFSLLAHTCPLHFLLHLFCGRESNKTPNFEVFSPVKAGVGWCWRRLSQGRQVVTRRSSQVPDKTSPDPAGACLVPSPISLKYITVDAGIETVLMDGWECVETQSAVAETAGEVVEVTGLVQQHVINSVCRTGL